MRVGRGSVAVTLLLACVAVLAWRSVVDIDVGLHLAGGRFVAETGTVPSQDPFTWTVSERPYVAYHWLFQLAAYHLVEALGVVGLVGFRFVLLLVVAALVVDVLRLRRVSPMAGAAVGLLALFAGEWRFTLRPELASWVLAAAVLWLLERRRLGLRAPGVVLPLLFLAWVNLHVWLPGFVLLGLYAADECWRRRSPWSPLLGWGAVSALAMLVNPYGLEGVLYPLELAARFGAADVFGRHIDELVSPFALAPDPLHPFTTSLGLQAYRLLLLAGIPAAIVHLRAGRGLDAAVILVFGVLASIAVRNVVLYVLLALPALAAALDAGLARLHAERRARLETVGLAAVALVALGLVPRVVSGVYYADARRQDRFAAEWCGLCLALDTADWVAAQPLEGHGLNNLTLGSVLVWRDTRHPVFIDGRNEVTGEAFYRQYLRAMEASRWPETKQRYALEYVALRHRGDERARALAARIEADPEWVRVHLDGAGVVFVRRDGPNGHLPPDGLPLPMTPPERIAAVAALDAIPVHRGLLAWLWSRETPPGDAHGLGGALLALGHPEAAERPLLESARAHPDFWETWADLGVAYRDRGRPGAALWAFKRAHALRPDHPQLAPIGDVP